MYLGPGAYNINLTDISNKRNTKFHIADFKIDDKDIKLVIYDFGFCWEIPEMISSNLVKMNQVFMDLIIEEKVKNKNKDNIDEFAEIAAIFCGKRIPVEIMKEEM